MNHLPKFPIGTSSRPFRMHEWTSFSTFGEAKGERALHMTARTLYSTYFNKVFQLDHERRPRTHCHFEVKGEWMQKLKFEVKHRNHFKITPTPRPTAYRREARVEERTHLFSAKGNIKVLLLCAYLLSLRPPRTSDRLKKVSIQTVDQVGKNVEYSWKKYQDENRLSIRLKKVLISGWKKMSMELFV